MANNQVFSIAPPTMEEMDQSPALTPQGQALDTFGPRISNLPPGTTPEMADVTVEQPVLPSRVTGKGELSGVAKAMGFEEGDQTGFDMGLLGDFARGFNDIVLYLPDAAINAVAEGLEYAGLVEPNVVDRNYLSRIFNSNDYESQKVIIPYLVNYGTGRFGGQAEEEGIAANVTRSAGQGVGLAIPFYGAANRTAQTSARLPSVFASQTAPSSQTTGTLVREAILNPYRTAPAATAAVEGTLAGLSGAGAQAEQDIFGTNTGLGALSPLAAPMLYTGLKNVVTKGPIGRTFSWGKEQIGGGIDEARVMSGKIDPVTATDKKSEAARTAIGQEIESVASTPTGQANIARASEIETALNPYTDQDIVFSPAEATMDQPLLTTQARLEATGDANFTRQNLDRKNNVLTAGQRFIDGEITGSPIDDAPLFIFDANTGRYNLTVGRLDAADQTLATKWNIVTDADTGAFPSLGKEGSKPIGGDMRSTVVNAHNAAKENAVKLANKLKINTADPLGSADQLDTAQTAVRNALVPKAGTEAVSYEGLPSVVKRFINFDGKRMSFQDWKQFRDEVSGELGKYAGLGNKPKVRQLAILADTLDDMAKGYGRTNEKFEDFRVWYDSNVILPFERSGVIKITSKGAGSTKDRPEYYLPDEQVAKTFLEDSNTAGQFMLLFADNPQQMRNMRSVVLDDIRTAAYEPSKGTFNPDKIASYLNRNREALNELGLYDEMADSSQLITNMVNRAQTLEARRRTVNSNLLFKTIGRLQSTDSPEKLLDSALNNPGLMRELREGVTRLGPTLARADSGLSADDAAQAFRAAVSERLLARAPDAMTNPQKFKEWLVKNERVMDAAFDKSHIDNMYLVADAAERILATGLPSGQGMGAKDIVTRLTESLGTTPAGISNRFIAVQEGRLGPKAAIGYVLSRAVRAKSTARSDALFREMMFDPELAKRLASEGGDSVAPLGISEPNKRYINNYMFNVGQDYGDGFRGEVGTNTFVIEANRPDEPITETPDPEPVDTAPVMPPIQPPPIVPYTPVNPTSAPAPNTAVPPNTQARVDPSLLFPNDSTSIAIARRSAPSSGIATI